MWHFELPITLICKILRAAKCQQKSCETSFILAKAGFFLDPLLPRSHSCCITWRICSAFDPVKCLRVCVRMCPCVFLSLSSVGSAEIIVQLKMDSQWISARSLGTQKAREECGIWKPTFGSRKKHSDIPVCVWVCSYVSLSLCSSCRGRVLHVCNASHPCMFHSKPTEGVSDYICQDFLVFDPIEPQSCKHLKGLLLSGQEV